MASAKMSGVKRRPLTPTTFIPGARPDLNAGPPKIASVTTPSGFRFRPMVYVPTEIPREMRPGGRGWGVKVSFPATHFNSSSGRIGRRGVQARVPESRPVVVHDLVQ